MEWGRGWSRRSLRSSPSGRRNRRPFRARTTPVASYSAGSRAAPAIGRRRLLVARAGVAPAPEIAVLEKDRRTRGAAERLDRRRRRARAPTTTSRRPWRTGARRRSARVRRRGLRGSVLRRAGDARATMMLLRCCSAPAASSGSSWRAGRRRRWTRATARAQRATSTSRRTTKIGDPAAGRRRGHRAPRSGDGSRRARAKTLCENELRALLGGATVRVEAVPRDVEASAEEPAGCRTCHVARPADDEKREGLRLANGQDEGTAARREQNEKEQRVVDPSRKSAGISTGSAGYRRRASEGDGS